MEHAIVDPLCHCLAVVESQMHHYLEQETLDKPHGSVNFIGYEDRMNQEGLYRFNVPIQQAFTGLWNVETEEEEFDEAPNMILSIDDDSDGSGSA